MERSGKWLIFAILGIALASGIFSWWFRWSATHHAAKFWGPQASEIIRDARKVTAVRMTDYDPLTIGPHEDHIAALFDASKARGLIHFKQALLEDRSYVWDNHVAEAYFMARYGVHFNNRSSTPDPPNIDFDSQVFVLFNDDCTRCQFVLNQERSPIVDCSPISLGLKSIFAEWLPPASN